MSHWTEARGIKFMPSVTWVSRRLRGPTSGQRSACGATQYARRSTQHEARRPRNPPPRTQEVSRASRPRCEGEPPSPQRGQDGRDTRSSRTKWVCSNWPDNWAESPKPARFWATTPIGGPRSRCARIAAKIGSSRKSPVFLAFFWYGMLNLAEHC